jgi:hypothetical protein
VQAAGQLESLPVAISFGMELLPTQRKIKKEGEFQVRLVNRCEAGFSLELSAADEAGVSDYRFRTPRVTLEPRKTKTIPLRVTARKKPSPGQTKKLTFSVQATPVNATHLAKTASGKFEVDPLKGQGMRIVVFLAGALPVSLLLGWMFDAPFTVFLFLAGIVFVISEYVRWFRW